MYRLLCLKKIVGIWSIPDIHNKDLSLIYFWQHQTVHVVYIRIPLLLGNIKKTVPTIHSMIKLSPFRENVFCESHSDSLGHIGWSFGHLLHVTAD